MFLILFFLNVVTKKLKITYMAQLVAYIMFWLDSPGLEAPSDVGLSLKNS